MRARSIRARIQIWFAGLSALLLLFFAVAVVPHDAHTTQHALDARLALRADALAALCELDDTQLVCDLDATTTAQYAGEAPARASRGATVGSLRRRASPGLRASPPRPGTR